MCPVKGPPSYWVGWGGSFHSSSIYTAKCVMRDVWRENLVYHQTTRWRRCSYLVYKQNTRGQGCLYWKTAPYAPQRLIYVSCPRFAPKTVDAPINPEHHIGRKLRILLWILIHTISFTSPLLCSLADCSTFLIVMIYNFETGTS